MKVMRIRIGIVIMLVGILLMPIGIRVDQSSGLQTNAANTSPSISSQKAGPHQFGQTGMESSTPPETQWNMTYGGTGYDYAAALVQTGDGGYALAGVKDIYGAGGGDAWLVKTDASGNMQWNMTYGGTDYDEVDALVQAGDGGYALAGLTLSYGAGGGDAWLVKTDASGNMQWNMTCGGTDDEYLAALVQTGDGGYALLGRTFSYGAGGGDFWLVKTDVNGNAQWNMTYGGTGYDEPGMADALVQASDGGYALAGYTDSFGAGSYDFWLVKTDVNGNAQWNMTYGGTGSDEAYALVQAGDGGYALAGVTRSYGAGSSDAWLIKTDVNGNAQWNMTYGGSGNDNGYSIVQTGDGGYAIGGATVSFGAGHSDAWLVKTDVNGNAQWNMTYGGTGNDLANALVQTSDCGYALAGATNSYGAGSSDAWLIKTAGLSYMLTVGVVAAGTGLNISGVNVLMQGPETSSGVTDDNGTVVFADIQPGSYNVTASKTGYISASTQVSLDENKTITVQLKQLYTMTVHLLQNEVQARAALQAGTMDILGWPVSDPGDAAWLAPEITTDPYVELGMFSLDLNNQKWPTGYPGFYDPASIWCNRSMAFRQAIACLLDRDSIVTNVLHGNGYRLDVPVPPFQAAYMDMVNYTASGLIYNFNVTRATELLDSAGFTLLPGHTWRQDPMTPGVDMKPLKFYIESDDTIRIAAGNMLKTELTSMGIPVTVCYRSGLSCYTNTVASLNLGSLPDFNLYTGGWSLSPNPDQYYDLYSSNNYHSDVYGFSQNYVGFCNHEFDNYASKVKYAANISEAREAAIAAGYVFLKYCPSIPMYCLNAVEAFGTSWTGVTDMEGYGIDNYYTFLQMQNPNDTNIDYGLRGNVINLNIINPGRASPSGTPIPDSISEDSKVLNLIYESLLGVDPATLQPTEYFIAQNYSTGSWDASSGGGDHDATCINFTIRDNIYWHNITGSPRRLLTVQDINFTFNYIKACGARSAWNYPLVAELNKTVLYPSEPNKIGIYYNKKSAWALQWAGSLPIINKDIWSCVPTSSAGWFSLATSDMNHNGIIDIEEDGTGPWQYVNRSAQQATINLTADARYYLSYDYVDGRLTADFHYSVGDVNNDGIVDVIDLGLMARAMFTNVNMTHGTNWGQYNPNCDLNQDGEINLLDLTVVASHYQCRMMGSQGGFAVSGRSST